MYIPPYLEAQIFGILIVVILLFALMWYLCGKCPLAINSWKDFRKCLWNTIKKIGKLIGGIVNSIV